MAKNSKKDNIHEIKIKIEGEEWKKANDKAFKERQKTVKVDGFRKGKVPRNIYEKHYGKESLYIDAANLLIENAYDEASEKIDFVPVVQPVADINEINENGVEFKFIFMSKPEVKVKKYKGLNVKKEKVKVENEEIDHELKHLLENYTELISKEEGKVENGNIAVIDYEGFKDGEAFEGGKGENYSLEIGSHTFIPGFEEAVIGMTIGEEKDINLTFPEDYVAEDLAGQDVVFKVKVNEIKEKKVPELNEDFFDDLGMDGIDSEEKLRKEIKSTIKSQKEVNEENRYMESLLEEISKNVEVDIPEEMVEEETDRLLKEYENRMNQQGLSLDLYYQFTQKTEKDLRVELEKESFNNILYRLMLEKILEEEKIEVTEEDKKEQIKKMAEDYKMSEEDIEKELENNKDYFEAQLKMRKLFELLKEYNK